MAKNREGGSVKDRSVGSAIFRFFTLQFVSALMCLLFGTSAAMFEIDWIVITVVSVLCILDCIFLAGEGIARGEVDDRAVEFRGKWNDEHPENQKKPLKFKPWLGFVYGFASAVPFIIIGIVIFVLQNDASRAVGRIVFAPFLPIMLALPDIEQTLAPAFSAVFPVMIGIGYIIGPYKRRRDKKIIAKAIKRADRRRNRKIGSSKA